MAMPALFHYSAVPLSADGLFDRCQGGIKTNNSGKPLAFYASIEENDNGWLQLLDGMDDDWRYQLRYRYLVSLKPEAKLLALDSEEAVLAFEREYGPVRAAPGFYPNWNRLRADGYHGFIVPAYEDFYGEGRWWTGLDCDCACIFDVGVIEGLDLVTWTADERQAFKIPDTDPAENYIPTHEEILARDLGNSTPHFDEMPPDMQAFFSIMADDNEESRSRIRALRKSR